MLIHLLRHGDAEGGDGDDAARQLTGKGEEQAQAAGRALATSIDACLASPRAAPCGRCCGLSTWRPSLPATLDPLVSRAADP